MPDLVLPTRASRSFAYSGIDSLEHCRDRKHFLNYPHKVWYNYNNRGFRDAEWPVSLSELQNAIWCVGDSYTVGIGSPVQHTWPYILQSKTATRTINVSMDGASNEWIARTSKKIITAVNPKHIVIMWSYTHRRESSNTCLWDEARRIANSSQSVNQDWQNFLSCYNEVNVNTPNAVHFAIPGFHPTCGIDQTWQMIRGKDWPPFPPRCMIDWLELPAFVKQELKMQHKVDDLILQCIECNTTDVTVITYLDLARDGHHFDIITADHVATQAQLRLNRE